MILININHQLNYFVMFLSLTLKLLNKVFSEGVNFGK